MFNHQTLFIVGAGASFEAGFPTGQDLAGTISTKMDILFEGFNQPTGRGDYALFDQLTNNMRQHVREYQEAAWLIRDGIIFARSIDDFLDMHRDNEYAVKYGKAAIVRAILEAEKNSNLFFQRGTDGERFNPALLLNTWFLKFAQMLGAGVQVKDVSTILEDVSFIVFNYDRCVEFFLEQALQLSHGLNADEAAAIRGTLDIVHPYGVIDPRIPFGSARANYVALSENIRTYTEQFDDPELSAKLTDMIARAHRIVFLGFAYHDQNMNLLRPLGPIDKKFVLGTAVGLSGQDVAVVRAQIEQMWAPHSHDIATGFTCARLFNDYAKTLTE